MLRYSDSRLVAGGQYRTGEMVNRIRHPRMVRTRPLSSSSRQAYRPASTPQAICQAAAPAPTLARRLRSSRYGCISSASRSCRSFVRVDVPATPLRSGAVGELFQIQRAQLCGDVGCYRGAVLLRQLFHGHRFGLGVNSGWARSNVVRMPVRSTGDNASRAGVLCVWGMISSFPSRMAHDSRRLFVVG